MMAVCQRHGKDTEVHNDTCLVILVLWYCISVAGSPTYRRHHMQCAPSLAYSNDMMTCVVDAQCDEYMEMMEEQGQGNGGHGNQRGKEEASSECLTSDGVLHVYHY